MENTEFINSFDLFNVIYLILHMLLHPFIKMQTDNIATQIHNQKGTREQSCDNVTNITPEK